MATHTSEKYTCDNCGKGLPTCDNSLEIVTSRSEHNVGWSRLHVRIERHHGTHNDCQAGDADLCQKCAISLLTDALRRVKGGERSTAGVRSSDQQGWD